MSYYLPIAGGRIIGFIPFPRVLVLCEMQSVSSKIWTRIDVSNSYDDNLYTTGCSFDYLHSLFLSHPVPVPIPRWLYQFLDDSTNSSITVPNTIDITVTFIFQSFQFPSKIPILLFAFFQFYSVVRSDSQVLNLECFIFFNLIIKKSCRLVEIRWSACMSKSDKCFCVSFSGTDAGLCIYHLFVKLNLDFLHNSQWITMPTQL